MAVEEGENFTRFFILRKVDNTIRELVSPSRGKLTTTEGIVEAARNYYRELYGSKVSEAGSQESLLGEG